MRGRTFLSGTEERSIEIAGHLDPVCARKLAGPGLAVREDGAGAEIEMLAFRMKGLALDGLPRAGMDYGEVLFRLGVEHGGAPAWFAVSCLLDRAMVASLAATLIRYPVKRVRAVDIDVGPLEWRLSATDRGAELRATLVPEEAPLAPAPVRPVLVRAGGRLLRVPWDETPAPSRHRARVTVEPGALERNALNTYATWTTAVVHEGRLHRCGIAGPTRPSPA